MKWIRKYYKYIIFLALYITFLSLSFYLGMKYQQRKPRYIYLQPKISEPTPVPIVTVKYPTPKSDLTNEWVKYEGRLEGMNFSIQYPKNWKAINNEGDKYEDDNQHIFEPLGENMKDLYIHISILGSGAPEVSCVKKSYPSGLWNYCVSTNITEWEDKRSRFRFANLPGPARSYAIVRAYFPVEYEADYEKILLKMLSTFEPLP